MGERVSFDTTFLIDFQRERRSPGGSKPAHRYLHAHPELELTISVVALGEFAEGFDDPLHPLVNWVRQRHDVLPHDEEVALVYGSVVRELRARGQLIGANDSWIAATALRHGVPLVTANEKHFSRVPGLNVRSYRTSL